ncbi:MAG: heparinase II/III domain-containing protein [Armatimonadota bacterium]
MFRTCLLFVPLLLLAASAFAVDHPVLPLRVKPEALDALRKSLAPLMEMPEAELLNLIPVQNGLYFVGCLNCKSGMQEGQLTVWDWRTPDQVKCKFCGHAYPSEKYPMTGVTEVKGPNGTVARYPYCDVKPAWWSGKEPYRSYFGARIDYHKLHFMEGIAGKMAQAYKLSGEAAYAHRAGLILRRFAEVYPGYCYHFDYPFYQKIFHDGDVAPKDFRGGFRTARWSWWAYMDISVPLLEAYDLIAETEQLPPTVEAMFISMSEQVLGNRDDLSNMAPGMWADLIRAGRVLGKPEYVHVAVGRLRRMMTEMFFADGSWQEGAPSYHSQVVGATQEVIQVAKGYSDPAGYKYPETGERFDNLDIETQLPEVVRAKAALSRMRLPNGRYLPVHDTWATGGGAVGESKPDLLGGLGQGILGFGKGLGAVQVGMTWSPGYGHIHWDGLALLLFAQGKELLSDLGYTHTRAREWTIQTPSHNLVVVDHANQTANKETQGNLRYFAQTPRVQVMSVDNPQVYPNVTSLYRRTVALVKLDDDSGYVVDVFRVKGGGQHDYFLHGSADEPQTLAVADTSLQPLTSLVPAGVTFTPSTNEQTAHMETGQAYGYLRDLKQTGLTTDTLVDLTYQGDKAGLQVFALAKAGDQLITGSNPAVRGAASDDSKLDQYRRQFAMLRRQGGDSLFVSIIAPFGEQRALQSAKLVELPGAEVALEIELGTRKDLVIIGQQPAKGQWLGMPVQTDGELTILETRDGKPRSGTVVAGSFKCGGMSLNSAGMMEAKLLGVERGKATLLLDQGFTPATGTVIVLDHGGKRFSPHTVKSATVEGQQVRVELAEDPGFEYNAATQTSKFIFLPRVSYSGAHVVRCYPVSQVSVK